MQWTLLSNPKGACLALAQYYTYKANALCWIVGFILYLLLCRETYHLEPSSKYGLHGNFNSVVYRASDVVYELEHKYCTSTDFPMLKLVQVFV